MQMWDYKQSAIDQKFFNLCINHWGEDLKILKTAVDDDDDRPQQFQYDFV